MAHRLSVQAHLTEHSSGAAMGAAWTFQLVHYAIHLLQCAAPACPS